MGFDGDMRVEGGLRAHRAWVIAAAVVLPLLVCAVLALIRREFENTNAALVLVLIIVLAAATGVRSAGIVAALSSAVWFDFFLTEPYGQLVITARTDIVTTVLLVLVGASVSEVALWGRRQQARASRQQGYLDGVTRTAAVVAAGRSSTRSLVDSVAGQIAVVLGIDDCRFVPDTGARAGQPTLGSGGTVTRDNRTVDVDRVGLPTDAEIALDVRSAGAVHGHYALTASTRVVRPTLNQRRVAVTLANQVGAALAVPPPTDE